MPTFFLLGKFRPLLTCKPTQLSGPFWKQSSDIYLAIITIFLRWLLSHHYHQITLTTPETFELSNLAYDIFSWYSFHNLNWFVVAESFATFFLLSHVFFLLLFSLTYSRINQRVSPEKDWKFIWLKFDFGVKSCTWLFTYLSWEIFPQSKNKILPVVEVAAVKPSDLHGNPGRRRFQRGKQGSILQLLACQKKHFTYFSFRFFAFIVKAGKLRKGKRFHKWIDVMAFEVVGSEKLQTLVKSSSKLRGDNH